MMLSPPINLFNKSKQSLTVVLQRLKPRFMIDTRSALLCTKTAVACRKDHLSSRSSNVFHREVFPAGRDFVMLLNANRINEARYNAKKTGTSPVYVVTYSSFI